MYARISWLSIVLAALPFGCQRLNYEKTFTVQATAVQAIEFSAPNYAQKLTVNVASPGAPVTVYVVKQEDGTAAQNRMDAGKAPENALAGKEQAEEIILETTVPAKTLSFTHISEGVVAIPFRPKGCGATCSKVHKSQLM